MAKTARQKNILGIGRKLRRAAVKRVKSAVKRRLAQGASKGTRAGAEKSKQQPPSDEWVKIGRTRQRLSELPPHLQEAIRKEASRRNPALKRNCSAAQLKRWGWTEKEIERARKAGQVTKSPSKGPRIPPPHENPGYSEAAVAAWLRGNSSDPDLIERSLRALGERIAELRDTKPRTREQTARLRKFERDYVSGEVALKRLRAQNPHTGWVQASKRKAAAKKAVETRKKKKKKAKAQTPKLKPKKLTATKAKPRAGKKQSATKAPRNHHVSPQPRKNPGDYTVIESHVDGGSVIGSFESSADAKAYAKEKAESKAGSPRVLRYTVFFMGREIFRAPVKQHNPSRAARPRKNPANLYRVTWLQKTSLGMERGEADVLARTQAAAVRAVKGKHKKAVSVVATLTRQGNPLGAIGSNFVSGAAAGVASTVAGVLAAPVVAKWFKGRKEKKAAKRAAEQNPKPKRNATRPASVSRLHKEFRGVPCAGGVTRYFVPAGSPADTAYLGRLHRVILANGKALTFRKNPAALLGGGAGRRRLYIGLSKPYAMPKGAQPNGALDYGEVKTVEYVTAKPHLYGTDKEFLFYHHLGEEGGTRPRLVLQNGRLALVGGQYSIRREGVRN